MGAASLRSVAQLADELPAFDKSAIRRLIFNAEENGLAPAIVRVGRRVFIDIEAFNQWLDQRRGQIAAPRPRIASFR